MSKTRTRSIPKWMRSPELFLRAVACARNGGNRTAQSLAMGLKPGAFATALSHARVSFERGHLRGPSEVIAKEWVNAFPRDTRGGGPGLPEATEEESTAFLRELTKAKKGGFAY